MEITIRRLLESYALSISGSVLPKSVNYFAGEIEREIERVAREVVREELAAVAERLMKGREE